MAGEHEPTLGEVYRLIQALTVDVKSMHRDLVGRAEYEADQEGIDRRFQQSSDNHNQLDTKVGTVEAKAEAKIAVVETKLTATVDKLAAGLEAQEKEQKQNRAKWVFALVMAGASSVLATVIPILIRGSA